MIRAGLFLLAVMAGPAAAECRQALALGLDVSGSVDRAEYRLQLSGLAAALMAPEVQAALTLPGAPAVRLMVFEWSGAGAQRKLVDWTTVSTPEQIAGVARRLNMTERTIEDDRTGLGAAMGFGLAELALQTECPKHTLDISGDGRSNHGPSPQSIMATPRVTINALAIGADAPGIGDRRQMEIGELVAYYSAEVLRGPGSFVEVALGFPAFEDAMRRKLLRELDILPVARADTIGGSR